MFNPLCEKCWIKYEKWLTEIQATDDLASWEAQEVLTRR